MIFVDGNYTYSEDETEVNTLELEELDWDDVNNCIKDLYDWAMENNYPLNFVEIWRNEEENCLAYFSKEDIIELCDPLMKRCKSIWRAS